MNDNPKKQFENLGTSLKRKSRVVLLACGILILLRLWQSGWVVDALTLWIVVVGGVAAFVPDILTFVLVMRRGKFFGVEWEWGAEARDLILQTTVVAEETGDGLQEISQGGEGATDDSKAHRITWAAIAMLSQRNPRNTPFLVYHYLVQELSRQLRKEQHLDPDAGYMPDEVIGKALETDLVERRVASKLSSLKEPPFSEDTESVPDENAVDSLIRAGLMMDYYIQARVMKREQAAREEESSEDATSETEDSSIS